MVTLSLERDRCIQVHLTTATAKVYFGCEGDSIFAAVDSLAKSELDCQNSSRANSNKRGAGTTLSNSLKRRIARHLGGLCKDRSTHNRSNSPCSSGSSDLNFPFPKSLVERSCPLGRLMPFRYIEAPSKRADMGIRMKKATLLFSIFGVILSAAPITAATVTLTSSSNPMVTQAIGNNNVYIGTYTLNIGGVSYAALCIDLADYTALNTSWTANLTTLDNRDLSTTYHPGSSTQYLEAAYLFNQINTPGVSSDDRTALQDAAWAIFESSAVSGVVTTRSNSYLADAVRYGDGMMASRFAVVSSVDTVHNREQEFLINTAIATPEPSTAPLLAAGFLMTGCAALSGKRRYIQKLRPAAQVEKLVSCCRVNQSC